VNNNRQSERFGNLVRFRISTNAIAMMKLSTIATEFL
jgi:hypothetical protein